MKKRVVRLTESDIENLVKKIIKESRIDEIGGYDSPELGNLHSKSTMEVILETFTDISDNFSKLNNMGNDILDDKLARETRILLKNVQPLLERYGKAWTSAEKRRIQK
jgi:hypothetical protein